MKILVDENIACAESLFNRLGDVQLFAGRSINASNLMECDALIVRSTTQVNANLLDGSRVKFVGTATAGTDHIDTDWLVQAGISFSSAPGCNAIAVVEYVLSALLYIAQRQEFSLCDRTIGIIGAGNIGGNLQRKLDLLGINTMVCDPPLEEAGVPGDWQSLEKLVTEANILTFHTPLIRNGKHATWHLVDEDLLTSLPDECIIINTCRGAVIDNIALLRVLEQGKPLSIILDVWENEPDLLPSLLARADIGTAHIAGYTLEGKIRGTVKIFNSYSSFIGNKERASLQELLPPSTIDFVRLHGSADEEAIRLLTRIVYDVRNDNIQLHNLSDISSNFDKLRKQYRLRREWSSLNVETDDENCAYILNQFGFQARAVLT